MWGIEWEEKGRSRNKTKEERDRPGIWQACRHCSECWCLWGKVKAGDSRLATSRSWRPVLSEKTNTAWTWGFILGPLIRSSKKQQTALPFLSAVFLSGLERPWDRIDRVKKSPTQSRKKQGRAGKGRKQNRLRPRCYGKS